MKRKAVGKTRGAVKKEARLQPRSTRGAVPAQAHETWHTSRAPGSQTTGCSGMRMLVLVLMSPLHFAWNNLKHNRARPGLQMPCLFGEHPKVTGCGAILSWPVVVKWACSKSRDFLWTPSSLFPVILFAYISQTPFLWGHVVGLDFMLVTLKQPMCYRQYTLQKSLAKCMVVESISRLAGLMCSNLLSQKL